MIYVSMYLCISVSMYLCIYVSMYLCIYVSMYLCMSVCMYACMYVCMYTHIDMYMYNYIYVYIIYIHTYIYSRFQGSNGAVPFLFWAQSKATHRKNRPRGLNPTVTPGGNEMMDVWRNNPRAILE